MARMPAKPEPKSDGHPKPNPRTATLVHEPTPAEGSIDINAGRWAKRGRFASSYHLHLEATNGLHHVWELVGRSLSCNCDGRGCHGPYLIALANALHFEKAPCPNCKKPVIASPVIRSDLASVAEYWHCPDCKAYGFKDRGRILPPAP